MTLAQRYFSKVKVTVYTYDKSVSVPKLLSVMLDLDDIVHMNVYHAKGVLDLGTCRQCQGQSIQKANLYVY